MSNREYRSDAQRGFDEHFNSKTDNYSKTIVVNNQPPLKTKTSDKVLFCPICGGMMLKRYDDMGIKDKIDFVKIDTEGHTYEVLKGMEEMLKRDKPMIWSEVWGEKIVTENGIIFDKKRGRESQKKIFDFLHSLGYKQMLDMGRENFVFINKNE